MSFIALETDNFDAMSRFYGETLGFQDVAAWDRPNGRGKRFDLRGLTLEILDNRREASPRTLPPQRQGVHLVIEVEDAAAERARLPLDCPQPRAMRWGATCFDIRDPDGVTVTFLQWHAR